MSSQKIVRNRRPSRFVSGVSAVCLLALYACMAPRDMKTPSDVVTEKTSPARPSNLVMASFYGEDFEGKKTASGEAFHSSALTAAHKSLPFGTELKVTNPKSGASVNVRVTDRGPFVEGRSLDLSQEAARRLGFTEKGVVQVRIEELNSVRTETR